MQTSLHSKGARISRFVQYGAWKYILTFVNYSELSWPRVSFFRSVTKSSSVSPFSLESAAAQARLKTYTSVLGKHLSGDHFTIHGFRSGVAVSLALEGVSLHEITWVGKVVRQLYTTSSSNRLSTRQERQLDWRTCLWKQESRTSVLTI